MLDPAVVSSCGCWIGLRRSSTFCLIASPAGFVLWVDGVLAEVDATSRALTLSNSGRPARISLI